jgi:hypothetical protein
LAKLASLLKIFHLKEDHELIRVIGVVEEMMSLETAGLADGTEYNLP